LFNILVPQYNLLVTDFSKCNLSDDIVTNDVSVVKNTYKNLGLAIKRKRLLLDISQERLSEIIGTTRQSIAKLESGKGNITILNVLTVLEVLKMNDIFDNLNSYNIDDFKLRASKLYNNDL
jgi:DNA-binding XRE family transcriptional regulator